MGFNAGLIQLGTVLPAQWQAKHKGKREIVKYKVWIQRPQLEAVKMNKTN